MQAALSSSWVCMCVIDKICLVLGQNKYRLKNVLLAICLIRGVMLVNRFDALIA